MTCLDTALLPFTMHGDDKRQLTRTFKRLIKPVISESILVVPSGKRKYSLSWRGRPGKLRGIQRMRDKLNDAS